MPGLSQIASFRLVDNKKIDHEDGKVQRGLLCCLPSLAA